MKVRFINTYEPVSSFYRDLLPYLAEQGVDVEVLISAAEYRGGRPPLEHSLGNHGIRIRYLPSITFVGSGRVNKVLIMLSYAAAASVLTLLQPRKSLNFFLSQPPLFSIWGYILKAFRGQHYVSLVMDLYPDVAVAGRVLSPKGIATRLFKKISRFSQNKASCLVVIGRCMEKRLQSNGASSGNIRVVPNWADERTIYPAPEKAERFRKKWGLDGRFILLYSGNMGVSHYFDDILFVAHRLKSLLEICFLFIGEGKKKEQIEEAKRSGDLDNVIVLPFQPQDQLAACLSSGDVHFISLAPGFEGLVVPSKAYGAMAVGKPILYQGDREGEIARVVQEEDIGTVVKPGCPDELEAVILQYYQNPGVTLNKGKRALSVALGRYGRLQAISTYYRLIVDTWERQKLRDGKS